MGLTRPLTAALLAIILITAHLALSKQSSWNGTINPSTLFSTSTTILPNTRIPIKLPSTNLPALDNYFAFMTSFFYATLDSRNVRAHWQGNHLLGSLSGIWMVMLMEAHGKGGGGFVAWTYVAEVMGELVGIGVWTPIWCLVHLLVTKGKGRGIGKGSLRALGWGLLLGHVVPTIGMLRLKADGEGVWSQQIWTIARLFHPVVLFGFWSVFKALQGRTGEASPMARRRMYVFSILASGFFHVTSLGFLLAPQMFSGWLKEEVTAALDPKTVLVPVPFWSEAVVKKVDFETGVAIFLQWDYLCSSAAIFVWAVGTYVETNTVKKAKAGLEMVVQTLGVALLAGPAAAAAFLMMERDEILSTATSEEKKRQ